MFSRKVQEEQSLDPGSVPAAHLRVLFLSVCGRLRVELGP